MSTTSPVTPASPPVGAATLAAPDVAALQRGLAAEHAACWAYGVVGAYLDGAPQRRARGLLAEHLAWRNRVTALLVGAGAEPAPARPAYVLPTPVHDAAAALALAEQVERAAAAVWADVLARLAPGRRAVAAEALQDTALRAAAWSTEPVAFPGMPERG